MAKEPKRKGLKAVLRNWLLGPVSSAGSILGMYTNGINAGVTVNTDTALRFTAVYAAIKLLAENIAGLPKSVMVRTKDGGYESAAKHPAHSLLYVRPNSWMDVFTFWFTIIAWLMGKGNALAVIHYEKGKPVALWPVHPDWVKVVFVKGEKMYIVKTNDPDFEFLDGTYLENEMLHFMLFTMNGLWGLTVATVLIPLLALVDIFLYKNRILQARLNIFLAMLCLGYYALVCMYAWFGKHNLGTDWDLLFGACIPLICFVLTLGATRLILKDEALVRAADRIR